MGSSVSKIHPKENINYNSILCNNNALTYYSYDVYKIYNAAST
jgi:hypothetical protein